MNTEINDLRIIICLRTSEVSIERVTVCKFIQKNLAEHGIYCLLCYNTYEVIYLLPYLY